MNLSTMSLTLSAVFPIEGTKQGKLAHFAVGVLFAVLFWYVLEKQYHKPMLNPITLFLACIWQDFRES